MSDVHQISIAGTEQSFSCASNDTILRAGLRAGLALPYECNVGACGNCKFELIEGEVDMLWPEAPGRSEKDKQRNRYLGCQCAPKGDVTIKVRPDAHYTPVHAPRSVRARLVSQSAITHDIDEFRFDLNDEMAFEPGQYALLKLPGVEGQRAYSMSNIVDAHKKELHFQIRRVPNGKGTSVLFNGLGEDAEIEVDGPYGMAYLRREVKRDILLIAGGSGLAPMISIARGVMTDPQMLDVNVHFIYGGRTPLDICGLDMLTSLPGFGTRLKYDGVVSQVLDQDPWTGPTGLAHEYANQVHGDRLKDMEIYFAGPPMMGQAIQKMLYDLKVPASQVHFDQFY